MDDRGTILIEAIIASAIVAMILAACYQVIGDSARRTQRAEEMRLALLTAQSQLAAAGSTLPLDGSASGINGPIDWRIDARPSGTAGNAAGTPMLVTVVAAMRVDPVVRITLRSVRLAAPT